MILTGCVALVTGGGGGIGAEICRHYAAVGARVVVAYGNNRDKAEQVATSLAGSGHLVVQAKVDDSAGLTALAKELERRYSKLDILVNNAGFTKAVPHDDLDGLDDELFDDIFRVNVRGAFATVRAFKQLLLSSDRGLVVNISSIAGRTGMGSNVAYCASKAAMDSLTRSLARALAPDIRVLSVAPGVVMGDYARTRMDPVMVEEQRLKTPLQRNAEAEDVARTVVAAATHLTFATGCVIPVDGGRPLN